MSAAGFGIGGYPGSDARESLRQAFRLGWIEDERWVRMLEDRNLSVHIYNEELAQAIYGRLPGYLELLEALPISRGA